MVKGTEGIIWDFEQMINVSRTSCFVREINILYLFKIKYVEYKYIFYRIFYNKKEKVHIVKYVENPHRNVH